MTHHSAEGGPNDAELLFRASRGDEAAFELIFRRHGQSVFAYLYRLVQDEAVAADLRQEAFIRLWRASGSWGGQESARPFLVHAARALSVDAHRRSSVRERNRGHAGLSLHTPPATPDDVLRRARIARRVEAAIAELSPRAREVFVLKRDAGLSYREIAEMLEISVKTVEVHMVNALRSLRASLADLQEGDV